MRSSKIRLEQIAAPENLRESFLRAARGKTGREAVRSFRTRLPEELAALRAEILDGRVELGRFSSFIIHEPKERRIHAPRFRERVLHHALIGPVEVDFERWLIDGCYACRRGKGRELALRRAEHFARRHPWALKLDVRKYFDSIPHDRLMGEMERRFRDQRVVALWRRIVEAYATAPGRGLPIGALTSQHLANFYLAKLDRLVKEQLCIKGYLRYMDDLLLFGQRQALGKARTAIECFLEQELGLALNRSQSLQPVRRGVACLGYRVYPQGSELLRSSRRRFLKRWAWVERQLNRGELEESEAQRRVCAMVAFAKVAKKESSLNFLFGYH